MSPSMTTATVTNTGLHPDSTTDDVELSTARGYDDEQIRLMEEVCIVIDENDQPLRPGTKKECRHLMSNIDKGLLHRAFSVFLFDPKTKKLLLQQRASEKITFPDQWTNTCCSHPLHTTSELGIDLPTSIAGAKRAAQRKLDHELGIKAEQVPIENMKFLTRIHYLSPSGQGIWGEHEMDYIIIIIADVDFDANPNEVRETRYVSPEELKEMFKQKDLQFTPWFSLICKKFLFEWWSSLDNLDKFSGEQEIIHRML